MVKKQSIIRQLNTAYESHTHGHSSHGPHRKLSHDIRLLTEKKIGAELQKIIEGHISGLAYEIAHGNCVTSSHVASRGQDSTIDDQLLLTLYNKVSHIPALKEDLTENFKVLIVGLIDNHEVEDLARIYASLAKTPELQSAAQDVINEKLSEEQIPLGAAIEILQAFPEIHSKLPKGLQKAFERTVADEEHDHRENLNYIIEAAAKAEIELTHETLDLFAIPAGNNTHDHDILISFNRATGAMKIESDSLEIDDLPELKAHWGEHSNNQRRTRSLPCVIESLREIAAGDLPDYANLAIVADPEKVAGWAARELQNANYNVPKFSDPTKLPKHTSGIHPK